MSLINDVISNITDRRQRLIEGKINCLPPPFERFKDDFIGVEKACYYTVTSFTKGKILLNLTILLSILCNYIIFYIFVLNKNI